MKSALSNLVSQVLVAFTIEFDNEFEHQMPHQTTGEAADGSGRGPWLVSQAMWANFMRYIEPGGVTLAAVESRARMVNLKGLERWGYITVGPDQVVRATRWGREAQEVWRPLAGVIEE